MTWSFAMTQRMIGEGGIGELARGNDGGSEADDP